MHATAPTVEAAAPVNWMLGDAVPAEVTAHPGSAQGHLQTSEKIQPGVCQHIKPSCIIFSLV